MFEILHKIIISPSTALLLLLESNKNDTEKYRKISLLILNGRTNENADYFDNLLAELPKVYEVNFDADFIHNDPVRRYFETHLAKMTLDERLPKYSLNRLADIYSSIKSMMPNYENSDPKTQRLIDRLNKILENSEGTPSGEYEKAILDAKDERSENGLKKELMFKAAVTAVYLTLIYDSNRNDISLPKLPLSNIRNRSLSKTLSWSF